MRRDIAWAALLLVLIALSGAGARNRASADAPSGLSSPARAWAQPITSLCGTRWYGADEHGDRYSFWLKSSGVLEYTAPYGVHAFGEAHWRQRGSHLEWHAENLAPFCPDWDATLEGGRLVARGYDAWSHDRFGSRACRIRLHQDLNGAAPMRGSRWEDPEGRWRLLLNADGTAEYRSDARGDWSGFWRSADNGWTGLIELGQGDRHSFWNATVDGDRLFGTSTWGRWSCDFSAERRPFPGRPSW